MGEGWSQKKVSNAASVARVPRSAASPPGRCQQPLATHDHRVKTAAPPPRHDRRATTASRPPRHHRVTTTTALGRAPLPIGSA